MATCWKCKGVARETGYLDRFFCSTCETILPVEAGVTHFELLGFEPPACDSGELRARYLELNRKLHPDLYMTRSDEERRASLLNVSAVNDAYRCLADTMSRARYWLEVAGNPLGRDNNRIDPLLAAEAFEIQEMKADLDGARDQSEAARLTGRLQEVRDEIEGRLRDEMETAERIMDRWPEDAGAAGEALEALKNTVSTASYLTTMARELKSALEDTWQESVA